MVDFEGIVRLSENDREIDGIEYEANHEMALHQLRMIAREAITQFSLHLVILHHRIGFVPTGEASLFLRAGCGHRQAAFKASEWIVNELKRRVPIWKKPRYKIGNKPPGRRQEALSA
jgi:molybdopterin synthase catalytic subunit